MQLPAVVTAWAVRLADGRFRLPDGRVVDDLQGSLTITTIIFAAIGIALYVVCFVTTREAVRRRTATPSMRQTATMLRHNRPLVLLSASSVLLLSGMFALITVAVYYARDVLGNADLYIVMTVAKTAGWSVRRPSCRPSSAASGRNAPT